jgi:anti-sigma B factor antagonist
MAELDENDRPAASVEVWKEDGTPVLGLSGDLDLVSVEHVRTAIESALPAAEDRVIFDVSGLEFMDSSGIALLVSVAQRVRQVELRHPTLIVRRLIELTGLKETLRLTP